MRHGATTSLPQPVLRLRRVGPLALRNFGVLLAVCLLAKLLELVS